MSHWPPTSSRFVAIVGGQPYDLVMTDGWVDGDLVITEIGDHRITVASLMTLLEAQRELTLAQGGGELLIRFFDDKPETIVIPYPNSGLALVGMSHVIAAGMVLHIEHHTEVGDGRFTAIAAFPDGSGVVMMGANEGPLTWMGESFTRIPLMHLVMTNIAHGRAIPAGYVPTITDWLLRTALAETAHELSSGGAVITPERADAVLRDCLSTRILILRHASSSTFKPRAVESDWPSLFDATAFVGPLTWAALDDVKFAVAQGIDESTGKWWSALGIVCLEFFNTPQGEDSLARLDARAPAVAVSVRQALDTYAALIELSSVPDAGLWRVDHPEQIVRLARKTLSDRNFDVGMSLLGYRRDGIKLRQTVRVDSMVDATGEHSLPFLDLDSAGDSDGVMFVVELRDRWQVSVLNRAGECGTFISESGIDTIPLLEGELLARLRHLLTGQAQAEPVCTPHDWLCRRILYGLALTLESGNLDGETPTERETESPPDADAPELSDPDSARSDGIDLIFCALVARHLRPFYDALRSRTVLTALPDVPPSLEEHLQLIADTFVTLRSLQWSQFDPEPLAKAWNVGLEDALWWRSDGIAYVQTFRMPDITESLMRCAFVIGRTPEPSALMEHLIGRTKQLFGDDVPVLWGSLPDM